jgi:hypothetical protein
MLRRGAADGLSRVNMGNELNVARSLAPEDLEVGQYVAITAVVHEVYLCAQLERGYGPYEPVRLVCTECSDGAPLKVLAVCIPFVLVADGDGQRRPLDIRRHRLARLPKEYARKALKKPKPGDGLGLAL